MRFHEIYPWRHAYGARLPFEKKRVASSSQNLPLLWIRNEQKKYEIDDPGFWILARFLPPSSTPSPSWHALDNDAASSGVTLIMLGSATHLFRGERYWVKGDMGAYWVCGMFF